MTLLRVLPVLSEPATAPPPALSPGEHERLYRGMLRLRLLDEKLLLLQRQGRIAFFGPSHGQEAAIIGSGFVARTGDWIFPALREGGVLLERGFPLERYFGQLFGNSLDVAKGRQQPMHFSSREHRFLSLSSVIATQLPQATGAAYAAKLRGDDCVVFGYLGDGATSEHDFHAALNFAAVWKAPVVFICQNNQWAISVPFEKQTASAGVAVKARAYGMPGTGVDGNDVLAVVSAVREAHARARAGEGPTLLELVTYRRGGHSSSDDPTRYRDESGVAAWLLVDPLDRYRRHLAGLGLWSQDREDLARSEIARALTEALAAAEAASKPALSTLVTDVYAEVPRHLAKQLAAVEGDGTGTAEGAFPL
jgi:pyruvate dehydrogenase E1 component alpha subunit